jgi:hypothetical protein
MMVTCRKCGDRFRARSGTEDVIYECAKCRTCANEHCDNWVFRPGATCSDCEEERKRAMTQDVPTLPKGKRRCLRCQTNVLSAYNRGKYCHSCWQAMPVKDRHRAKERFVD